MPAQQENHVLFCYLPYNLVRNVVFRMRGISAFLLKLFPDLPESLRKAQIKMNPVDYIGYGAFCYFVYGLLFGGLIWFVGLNSKNDFIIDNPHVIPYLSVGSALLIWILLVVVLVILTRGKARSYSKEVDRMLLYAMKDLLLQINSGNTLFASLVNLAHSKYGAVSELVDGVVRKVNAGNSLQDSLEELLDKTHSDYFKRAVWQMLSSLKSGSDLRKTLGGVIDELNNDQKNQILAYARELNLWSLVYMLFAVAIPTIGSTMLVILSSFAGFGIDRMTFAIFIGILFVVQYSLVILVKSRRPVVQF